MSPAGYQVVEPEYLIEYTIKRIRPDDADWSVIGFGTSGTWATIDAASHALGTDVEHFSWETSGDMPDPSEVRADLEARRAGADR